MPWSRWRIFYTVFCPGSKKDGVWSRTATVWLFKMEHGARPQWPGFFRWCVEPGRNGLALCLEPHYCTDSSGQFNIRSGIKKDHVQCCRRVSDIFVRMLCIGFKSDTFTFFHSKSLTVGIDLDFARKDRNKFCSSL